MLRVGAIVRLLMLLAALAPFTSERQAQAALAPYVPLAPLAPVNEAPAPVNEEDDERETAGGKERLSAHSRHRPPARHLVAQLSASHPRPDSRRSSVRSTPAFPVDPFRNGLGTPYRC